MDIPHGDNDAAVSRYAGERVSIGALLGEVRKRGVPEDVRLEPLDTRIRQRTGVLIFRDIPVEMSFGRPAQEHPALAGATGRIEARETADESVRRQMTSEERETLLRLLKLVAECDF